MFQFVSVCFSLVVCCVCLSPPFSQILTQSKEKRRFLSDFVLDPSFNAEEYMSSSAFHSDKLQASYFVCSGCDWFCLTNFPLQADLDVMRDKPVDLVTSTKLLSLSMHEEQESSLLRFVLAWASVQ